MYSKRKLWAEVLRRIKTGEMPPDGKPQPKPEEKQQVLIWIEEELFPVDCENPDPGRVTIRRLNRAEYRNTIRDLVGLDFQATDDFPVDDTGYGFDNIGDALSVSPLLLERYLAAAESILDRAILDPKNLPISEKRFAGSELLLGSGGNATEGIASLPSNGEVYAQHKVPTAGEYRFKVWAFAQQAGPEIAKMGLSVGGTELTKAEVKAVESAPGVYEVTSRLSEGEHRFAAAFLNDYYQPTDPDPGQRDRNLFIEALEIVGPLDAEPPPFPETHQRIFICYSAHHHTVECTRAIITRFAKRAFRRPASESEIQRLVNLAGTVQSNGATYEASIKVALQAVLVSPHFLFRGELQPEPDNPRSQRNISEYALGSRLSYFLWSSMPDYELFDLADKGELRRHLPMQVSRMLQDPKSHALAENFSGQWLQTRNLAVVTPDPKVFPQFDDSLRQAMEKETLLFFEHVMSQDRSVMEFVTGDYTFVNEKLASHYGVRDVIGPEFRQVSLPGTGRASVLTHGSVDFQS